MAVIILDLQITSVLIQFELGLTLQIEEKGGGVKMIWLEDGVWKMKYGRFQQNSPQYRKLISIMKRYFQTVLKNIQMLQHDMSSFCWAEINIYFNIHISETVSDRPFFTLIILQK